ncbi:hypothetical protein MCOR27_001598 [Pyricularia oryzae]|uniref:Uncharacterized protein n=2 Tax=Pyricularia TaxID=48558 RepID=A0ABQ8NKM0_PYRGI|nr:hypothetical protein MCOR01_005837 [Pyricularia oryzae]KAI6298548.1 hypothetical protein MCOR33_005335 [Pyricularia grisea]KAH9435060.1 hypothetical protein MCOR02_004017 [Pyricularia oryzae]KAI6286983.1 hypothetical protein MCOR27_001598 [Pyricularia oryzae]KAI6317971.1 hypothetical protein MCOR34_003779 [Pyricularia oryzae]
MCAKHANTFGTQTRIAFQKVLTGPSGTKIISWLTCRQGTGKLNPKARRYMKQTEKDFPPVTRGKILVSRQSN